MPKLATGKALQPWTAERETKHLLEGASILFRKLTISVFVNGVTPEEGEWHKAETDRLEVLARVIGRSKRGPKPKKRKAVRRV